MKQETPSGWTEKEKHLECIFSFPNFSTALSFVNKIGILAEEMNHHPDIELTYGKVVVRLTTHNKGDVTEKDYELAVKINSVL